MRCAWKELLEILPLWMRQTVDRQGKETLQELRLRLDRPPELVTTEGSRMLEQTVTMDDLCFCINTASRYSPWTAATAAQGYITAPGGHRLGLCGEAAVQQGQMTGIRGPTSLCIRVARDFPGIAARAAEIPGSILILGRPGSGKTTLLRDLIRQISTRGPGSVAVVDERGELFPIGRRGPCFAPGPRTDVLTGCNKPQGIDVVLRTMGTACIAVDEITADSDCEALFQAGWCGVRLLATAHAAGVRDLAARPVYKKLRQSGLFEAILVLQPDKSWKLERIGGYS